jgi:hypothetical protein
MNGRWHVPINSIYVELVRLRYRGADYGRYWVRYYSKASGTLIKEERSVKIRDKARQAWEEWRGRPF